MANSGVLTPLPDDGTRGPRLEIDEFCLDNEMTNLFLVALSSLQQKSLDPVNGKPNWMKFYAIAGIHGKPDERYNDVGKPSVGYCHHSLNTFPTWHRPYMFLFELAVYNEMVKQADQYSGAEKEAYKKAAARFRLPYWDIVMPRNTYTSGRSDTVWGCPAILKVDMVTVRLPKPTANAKDGWDSIHNPLYSFVFPKPEEYQKSQRPKIPFSNKYNTTETTRIPTNVGVSNVPLIDLAIQRQAAARATMMWQMLNPDLTAGDLGDKGGFKAAKINDYRNWEAFANRDMNNQVMIQGKRFVSPSIESWHDGIHVLMGTGSWYDGGMPVFQGKGVEKENQSSMKGQMGDPNFAAFDPIFFLHHCNIDRLLAIYEALFPDKYCDPTDADEELKPFLNGKTSTSCWKSSDAYIKDYWNAGYAVPGNKKPAAADAASVRQAIMQYLSGTYYWATSGVLKNEALPKWPKDLSGLWALQKAPPKNIVASAPVLQMTALKLEAGVPQLFAREVALPIKAETAKPQVKDMVIKANSVLDITHTADAQLPDGAFKVPVSEQQPAVQITWNAYVKVRKFAFNGSFSVHLFVGWVKDEQPERYMTKKNEAGFTGVFASPPDNIQGCTNCAAQREQDIVVDDVIPLTTILYDYLEAAPGSEALIRDGDHKTIPNLSANNVVPFLKEQLRWRIIDLDATLLADQEQQAGLEITVSSRPFTPPTAENLMGVYGPETVHIEITNDKPGGYGYTYPTAT